MGRAKEKLHTGIYKVLNVESKLFFFSQIFLADHFFVDCCNHSYFGNLILQFSAICCCLDLANIGGILPRNPMESSSNPYAGASCHNLANIGGMLPRSCTRSLFLQMRTNCQIAAFLLRQQCSPWIAKSNQGVVKDS